MSQNQIKVSDNPLGKSTDDSSHENYGNALNEPIALEAKVQMLETENKQLLDKCSKLEKEMREKLLKKESLDEFAEQKFRSLEENYLKEIAELKAKNQKLTEENKAFEEKLEKLEEMIQMNQEKISETENEIMVPMHEMKVQLPLENWHDLLAFVPRCQLGNVVSEIGDYQFANIIQSFLHDPVKEITLRKISIIPPRSYVPSDLPAVHVSPNEATNMPDWPMPENVKDFKQINLNYVDTSVLNFLEKFQENSLLTDVNIYVYLQDKLNRFDDNILPQVLTEISPFITSIDSITFPVIDLFDVVYGQYKYNNNTQLLLKEMLAKTRILLTDWNPYDSEFDSWEDKLDWRCSWLNTPRNDGKPRMLIPYPNFIEATDCASFIERIKKDFETANNPVSFFIYVDMGDNDDVPDISIDNMKSNEKLVIKTKMDGKWKMLLISRYPLNAAKKWIEANEKEISEWDPEKLDRKIKMDDELTIEM